MEKQMKRESIVFYASFHRAIRMLETAEERDNAYAALLEYALEGIMPEPKGVAGALFEAFRPLVDANARKYDAAVARRNRKLGLAPEVGPEPPADSGGPTDMERLDDEPPAPPEPPADGNGKRTEEAGGGTASGGTPPAEIPNGRPPAKKAADAPPVPPPPPKQWLPDKKHVAELHAECAGHDEWLRVVEMKNSMRPGEGRQWLRGFAMHLISSGRTEETEQEFKRYFANWAASEIRKGRRPINSAPPGSGKNEKMPHREALRRALEEKHGILTGNAPASWEAPPAGQWPPPPAMEPIPLGTGPQLIGQAVSLAVG